MWRSLMRTTPACRETWKPAVWLCPTTNSVEPAADVDHNGGLRRVGSRSDIAPRNVSCGLLVPGEGARVEAVVAAHALGEGGPVGGVAHGGGEHGEVGLAAVAVDQLAVVGEHRAGALDGLGREPPVGVHARAEAGDAGEAHELGHGPLGLDVGEQQAGGVGADVHHGDAHGRGWYRGARWPRLRGRRRRGPWPQSGRSEGARSRREPAARGGASGVSRSLRGTAGAILWRPSRASRAGVAVVAGFGAIRALDTNDYGASA